MNLDSAIIIRIQRDLIWFAVLRVTKRNMDLMEKVSLALVLLNGKKN